MQLVSRPHASNLVRWAQNRPQSLVLSADLTASCEADLFRESYPQRFFSMGMAEQNMMGFASGLAREGFEPLVHTFAVFICRRAYDQVAMSIAYPNLAVRMFGFLPGLTTPGGVTHQSIDDLALMRALPNMTVLECGDATEVESVLDVTSEIPGPVYVRMLRGEVPRLFPKDQPLHLGMVRQLSSGDDMTLLTSGVCTELALPAVAALRQQGLGLCHLHITTLKPFAVEQLEPLVSKARLGVITMENHSTIGGLGSATAEMMARLGLGQRLLSLGLQDTYAHGASRDYLMHKFGMDAAALLSTVEQLSGQKFQLDGFKPSERSSVEPAVDAKPEAL